LNSGFQVPVASGTLDFDFTIPATATRGSTVPVTFIGNLNVPVLSNVSRKQVVNFVAPIGWDWFHETVPVKVTIVHSGRSQLMMD